MRTRSEATRFDVYGCERRSVPPHAALGRGTLGRLAAYGGFGMQAYLALASLLVPPGQALTLGGPPSAGQSRRRSP